MDSPPIPLRVPSFLPSPCILLTRNLCSYLPRLFSTCSIDSSHATAPVERENQLYTCTAVALCLPLSVPSLLPYTLTARRPSPHPQHTSPHVRCKLPSPLSPLPSPSPPLPPAQIPSAGELEMHLPVTGGWLPGKVHRRRSGTAAIRRASTSLSYTRHAFSHLLSPLSSLRVQEHAIMHSSARPLVLSCSSYPSITPHTECQVA